MEDVVPRMIGVALRVGWTFVGTGMVQINNERLLSAARHEGNQVHISCWRSGWPAGAENDVGGRYGLDWHR